MATSMEKYLGVAGEPVMLLERGRSEPSRMATRLAAVAPWLRLAQDKSTPEGAPSTELQGSRPHGTLKFVGDIEQRMLEPLVEALRALATGQVELDTPATRSLIIEAIKQPMALDVVVGPICRYCPAVTAAALRLSCLHRSIATSVLRAGAVALATAVHATPTVLLNGNIIAAGSIGEYRLAEKVAAIALASR